MHKVLVHYAEIALKGRNRYYFEDKVIENIKKSASYFNVNLKRVRKEYKRLLCIFEDSPENIKIVLGHVFGIRYFCIVEELPKKTESVLQFTERFLKENKKKGFTSVSFKTKRADKTFPLTSVELNTQFGEIASQLGLKVDYSHAPITLFTEITEKEIYCFSEKLQGAKGLPVSSGGKVLVLLSGGIDSPVSAWQIMSRGCSVDFMHVHPFSQSNQAEKIETLVKILNKFQWNSKLYLISYAPYEAYVSGKIPSKYDLVFFKHYLLKLGEKLALDLGYDAIVTGDNLGQVASQTIENMKASGFGLQVPLFTPLLTHDKETIIEQAKKIETYDLSIKSYKDCCSLFALHPSTRTKLSYFQNLVKKIPMEKLVEKSLENMEIKIIA